MDTRVSSHLAQRESRIEMDLPIAVSGASDQPDDSKRVTINILADGQMSVAGRAIVESDLNQVFDAARAGSDKIEIRIRGDRATTYDSVSPVLKAITEAGIWDVSFAVVEESSR